MSDLLTIAETARLLKVSIWTVYALAKKGHLPVKRVGSQLRVHPGELERALGRGIGTYSRRARGAAAKVGAGA